MQCWTMNIREVGHTHGYAERLFSCAELEVIDEFVYTLLACGFD